MGLSEVLAFWGRGDVVVHDRIIVNAADALAAGMPGWSTIFVDGRGPFAADGAPVVLCRVFRTDNWFDGAPCVADLGAVLE